MVLVDHATFLEVPYCSLPISDVEVVDALYKEEIGIFAGWYSLSLGHHYYFKPERIEVRGHLLELFVINIKVAKHVYFGLPLLLR